ncbi:uncharacterized protein [Antedon mediterranea]|uniref:uncharacterized protein n=1 Tax=Antedon mediterranea TaxID=105859 RepID=UPI003AF7C651
MEMISDELTTVKWSRKYYTPSELAEKRKSFPIIVKIAEGAQGNGLNEDYSTGQVLYLHSVKEQLRFFAYDEEGNEFSIPINSDIGLETADIQEESSVLLHEDLELPLKVKVNSNQHTRLPDLVLEEKNLTIKQKDLMKYLMGTCISEDAGIKKTIEYIPTECSNLSLQVPLMIGDGTDDRLTLFEEHVQDVVHSVIDESTFNSYQGNPDTIVTKPIEIEESSNEPHVNKPDTKNKGKKKKFRFIKYKKKKNIQTNPKKCTSQPQDDACSKVEKIDGRPKGKRKNVKKYTRNIDKASNIIGEKSQNLCDSGHSYEKEIYLKKNLTADEDGNDDSNSDYEEVIDPTGDTDDYEEVYEGKGEDDDYEDVLVVQHEEEEGDSYNDEDYENKIYIQKDLTGTITDVGDDSEYEDIDIQKDPRESNTHEEGNKDTCIDDDGYLEVTDIHKGKRKMTANEEGNNDNYREDDDYEDVLVIQHEEEEGDSYNDEDYENKIYIQKDLTGTTTNVGGDDSEYEDIDIQKDPREGNTHEEDDNDTCIDDGYLEPTDIQKSRRKMTADTNSESDGYEDINDISKDTYIDYDGYLKLTDIQNILPMLQPRNTPEEHRIRVKEDLPDNLSDMSCNQVQDCLKLLKLDKHIDDFQKIGINGDLLLDLDRNTMKTKLKLTEFEALKLEMFIKKKWLPLVS